VLAALKLYI